MSRSKCDLCDNVGDMDDWSIICDSCKLCVHDAKGLAEEVKRLNHALDGALNEMERSSEEAESLRLLLKRGATLSYRGQGWRVVGLTLCGSTATYDTEDAALDAAVAAVKGETP